MDLNPSRRKRRGRWVISVGLLLLTGLGVMMLRGSSAVFVVQPLLVGAIVTPAQSVCGVCTYLKRIT